MDIERLKEWANTQNIGTANMSYHKAQEHVLEIINESNQSATSEEVQEAIDRIHCTKWDYDKKWYKAIDLAITALQAYQPWIPVSERLPMEEPDGRHSASKMVLVYAYDGYSDRFASTDITVDGKWYNYSEPEFEVTHWMPLPEPPKGE